MIEHLPLPIMVAKTDMKDDLKKKFIKVINDNVSLNFKSLKYPEVTNITELLCYLKLENPRRRMTSKEKDNIIALSKKIIHYCDMDYSTELSDYNTQQEIIDDMNYIRQYGDLLSVRKACERYNKQSGIVKLEPILSVEKREQLKRKVAKKNIHSRIKFERKPVILTFD
jgi:regulator of replication initiation timing